MSELRSCPFCGDDALLCEKLTYGGGKLYGVGCMSPMCPGSSPQWCLDSDSAIEVWNAREEPAVHVESSHLVHEPFGCSYIDMELSCGHEFSWDYGEQPSYCPYCGAKVVRDD